MTSQEKSVKWLGNVQLRRNIILETASSNINLDYQIKTQLGWLPELNSFAQAKQEDSYFKDAKKKMLWSTYWARVFFGRDHLGYWSIGSPIYWHISTLQSLCSGRCYLARWLYHAPLLMARGCLWISALSLLQVWVVRKTGIFSLKTVWIMHGVMF